MENDQEKENMHEVKEFGVGVRFSPTDKELALYFLRRKLDGQPLPYCPIQEYDLYGDKNPWELFDKNSDDYVYVFTKLKKRNRSCGLGTWRCRNRIKVTNEEANVSFFKREFIFDVKKKDSSSSIDCGHWICHEFSLQDKVVNDYVLCRIRNKHAEEDQALNDIEPEAAIIPEKREFPGDEEGEENQHQKKRLNSSSSHNAEFLDNGANTVEAIPFSIMTQEYGLDAEVPAEFDTLSEYGVACAPQESYSHLIPIAEEFPISEEEAGISETGAVGSMNMEPAVEDLTTLFSVSEIGVECRSALEAEIERLLANPHMPLLA